jgi:hypothetical protein
MTTRHEYDMKLVASLVHSKDIWTLRAGALASMLAPLGVDVNDILTADKNRCIAYMLRSGITANIEGVEWDDDELLDMWRTPIEGA